MARLVRGQAGVGRDLRRALHALTAGLVAVGAGGCGGTDSPTEPDGDGNGTPTVVAKALALSPSGFPASFDALPAFMAEAAGFPDAGILWNGAWRDDVVDGTDAGDPPDPAEYVAQQADPLDFAPVAVFGWRSDDALHIRVPEDATNDWSNDAAAELFAQMAADYAETYEPAFVFLGNESDIYFDDHPTDYLRWVEVFEEAYARIKAASPSTQVGPVFQYERMAGIGDLAGTPDVWESPSWGALEAHDPERMDVVGLTLYPFFAHATPEQIPDDYLDPVRARIGDLPLAITETGWPARHAGDFAPPWEASEAHQVTYIEALERILEDQPLRLVTWLFLHPPVPTGQGGLGGPGWDIFHSLSLRDAQGEERPVYEAWRDAEFTPGPS